MKRCRTPPLLLSISEIRSNIRNAKLIANLERNQPTQYFQQLPRKCNQSLRQKHYPSGQSFCKSMRICEIYNCRMRFKSKPFHWVHLSAMTLHCCLMIANKTELWILYQAVCSNQTNWFKRDEMKSIWTPKNESYLCTTIEVIPCWRLDRYSRAAMLCLIFTCNAHCTAIKPRSSYR